LARLKGKYILKGCHIRFFQLFLFVAVPRNNLGYAWELIMKKITAYLLILLIITASLLGCSKRDKGQGDVNTSTKHTEDEGSGSMGRYMEKNITLPELSEGESILKILENPNKEIEIYTMNNENQYIYYKQKTDLTWEKNNPEWLNTYTSGKNPLGVVTLCYGEDGNIYACLIGYQENESKNQIIVSDDGGNTAKKIDITYLNEVVYEDDKNKFYSYIQQIAVLANGNLLLYDMWNDDNLLVFNKDGEQVDKIPFAMYQNFTVDGNVVITPTKELTGIMFYDTVNKKVDKTIEYPVNSSGAAYSVSEDGSLWLGDAKGIHHLPKEGTLWETMVDGELNSMSKPISIFDSLFVKDESYYGVYKDSNSLELSVYSYIYDETVSAVPDKKITVYSLWENSTVRQAISMYQGANPDVRVEYIVAMGEEEGNISDYIRALNTELLAGSGADVLLLDGLPINSYIQKGILMDMESIMNPMLQTGELLPNIAKSYEKEAKFYHMPIRFSLPVAVGSKEAVESLSDIDSVVKYMEGAKEKPLTTAMSYRSMINNYLAIYSKDLFVDNKLSEERLVSFLENLKLIAKNIGASEYIEGREGYQDEDFKNKYIGSGNLFMDTDFVGLKKWSYNMGLRQIQNINGTMLLFAAIENQDMVINSVKDIFIPNGIVGINNASKEVDTVKDFVSFLFSKEVQNTNVYDGFPVNSNSLTQWEEEENEDVYVIISNEGGDEIEGGWPEKEKRETIINIAKQVTTPVETNQTLNDMIVDEAVSFLLDKTDSKQAAAAVKSKVDMYLAE
jgi:ABC-type glycerol-3-phosphate transport system substrate-binding protein